MSAFGIRGDDSTSTSLFDKTDVKRLVLNLLTDFGILGDYITPPL